MAFLQFLRHFPDRTETRSVARILFSSVTDDTNRFSTYGQWPVEINTYSYVFTSSTPGRDGKWCPAASYKVAKGMPGIGATWFGDEIGVTLGNKVVRVGRLVIVVIPKSGTRVSRCPFL